MLCFGAGVAIVFFTRVTPLATISNHYLLSAHLIQNIAIAEWAPALLVLGIPPALGAFLARVPGARLVTYPPVALAIWLGTYIVWHLPWVYDAALEHPRSLLHLEHLCYLAAGVVLWWPVFQDAPQRLSSGAKALYLAAAFFFASPLGLVLSLLGRPIYTFYEHAPAPLGDRRAPRPADRRRDHDRRGGDPLLRARRVLRRPLLPGGGIDRRSQFARTIVAEALASRGRDALVCRLRRARSASRSKPNRAAVGGSRRPVGWVDESETGSASFLVPSVVGSGDKSELRKLRRVSFPEPLQPAGGAPSVLLAPSTGRE